MKVYIAGPITGRPGLNRDAFEDAEYSLGAAGYEPLNPHGPLVDGWTWTDYMRRALTLMLRADAVALLDGWSSSRGAQIEKRLADDLRMPSGSIHYITHWTDGTR